MMTGSTSRLWMAILIAAASLGALPRTSAAEPAQSPEQRQKEIAQLIEQLASENPAPTIGKDSQRRRIVVFAPEYALEKQKKVYKAARRLLELGTDAFSQLIEHFDDARYSYDFPSPTGWDDNDRIICTVGSHCHYLLTAQVSKYASWGAPGAGWGPTSLRSPEFATKENARQWWSKNKDEPLWRIQAERLQWAIDVEVSGEKDAERRAAESGLDANARENAEWRVEHAARAIEMNRKLLAEVLSSKKPLTTGLNLGVK